MQTTSSPQPLPWLDRAHLDEVTGGDEELARELLGLFAADLPGMAGRLAAAAHSARAGDFAALAAAAHEIKGAAGNLGLARLAAVCGELEALAKRGEAAALEALLDEFNAARQDFEAAWQVGR